MKRPKNKIELEKAFKRFKKKYFKDKISFTGTELLECKSKFWKQFKLWTK